MPVRVKRVYETPLESDGYRVLVDRLWPRGISKERAAIAVWLKEAAPSEELRKWYCHDPALSTEFRKRYRAELRAHREVLAPIVARAKKGTVTLVFAAKDEERNNAVVMREWVEKAAAG
jgi:uncharacterized protein YeaO (DUF488 family)